MEDIARPILNGRHNGISVQPRAAGENLEDQQIERSL
jgi:hypothetical protein